MVSVELAKAVRFTEPCVRWASLYRRLMCQACDFCVQWFHGLDTLVSSYERQLALAYNPVCSVSIAPPLFVARSLLFVCCA